MKIAILSFFGSKHERGVERWVDELSNRLAEKHELVVFQNYQSIGNVNYKVVTVGIGFDDSVKKRLDLNSRIYLDYRGRKTALFSLKILTRLWKDNYDIIIPTDGGWEPAFIRILTWLRRKKMIIVGHSGKGWDDRNNIYCFPDIFVALSETARKWCVKINPLIKTINIPDGVDLRKFKATGEKAQINLERPVFLCVAATERGKQLNLAIEAVSKTEKGSLLVLGSGSENNAIDRMGNQKLGKRYMRKVVNFEEISKYYRSCDLFTLPSWSNEAFGMVYLEAMASGLPVVATDDELRREIVGNAGILVDPTNIDEYAKALEKALSINWGNKPRKQAEKFSWEVISDKYNKLFQSLL